MGKLTLCDSRSVLKVYKLYQVAIGDVVLHARVLMLMREILYRLREAHSWVSRGEKGFVVSSSQISVGTIYKRNLHPNVARRTRRNFRDVSAKILGRRVVPAANDANLLQV